MRSSASRAISSMLMGNLEARHIKGARTSALADDSRTAGHSDQPAAKSAEPSDGLGTLGTRGVADPRADRLAGDRALDVTVLLEVEDQDRQLVVQAHADG